jgi:hypothetical protein
MTTLLPSRAHPNGRRKHETGNYQQRLKAAGLDGDMPDDMDEFRNRLARCIVMFINAWHGCPEPLCRRHQGCMAPNGQCTNLPPASAEEMERDWPEAKVKIHTELKERLAAHGAEAER